MNRTFDFYEYAGVIIPGAVLLLGLLWLFPDQQTLLTNGGLTFGEFGVFIIIAYAAGQLIQSIGNAIEWIFWKISGGLSSTRVLRDGTYIGPQRHKRLLEQLQADFNVTEYDLRTTSVALQLPVVRDMYSVVLKAKKTQRLDIFVGNYGLARGLASALLVLSVTSAIFSKGIPATCVLAILFLLALQRMHRFGRHYATELVTEFLATKR